MFKICHGSEYSLPEIKEKFRFVKILGIFSEQEIFFFRKKYKKFFQRKILRAEAEKCSRYPLYILLVVSQLIALVHVKEERKRKKRERYL